MAKHDELQRVLASAQYGASGQFNSTISHQRARLMARMDAEPYGDEVEDRSTYVDTSTRDTKMSIMPELMDIFLGGDRVVEFTPHGTEDVDAAEQETEVVNHMIQQKNEGYKTFYDWFDDALGLKNGYVKRYWEERLTPEVEEYADLTREELVTVVMQADERGEVEFLEQEITDEGRVNVKFRITPEEAHHYRVEAVPPEEVVVHPEWTRLDFDGCPFVAHRRAMRMTDLVEMGFNRKQIEDLPSYDPEFDSEERQQRFAGEDGAEYDYGDDLGPSMRTVLVYENYVRFDMNGDGVAELLQVYTGGEHGVILKRGRTHAIEEVDSVPFNVICPHPVPHKHYGFSVVELMEDLQRIRTVLVRQMLDNFVLMNNPETWVDEDAMSQNTVEDLAVSAPGRVIRVPGGMSSGGTLPPPEMASNSLAALEFLRGEGEQRTGVTRFNQGIDKDALNKTFGGMKALMNAAQKKILLIARTFAETGVKSLFRDVHRDLRKGPMKRITMRLRNEWVSVDPRTWKERADMAVNVGLGTGDRDIQFERLGMVLQQQKEDLAMGLVEPIHLHRTKVKMLELSGFKDAESFFPKPPPGPLQQQGESPEAMLAKVEMEKTRAKEETDRAKMQAEMEFKREDAAMDAQMEAEKLLFQRNKADIDAEIERMRLQLEEAKIQLEREKAGLEREKIQIEARKAEAAERSSDHSIRSDIEKYDIKRDEVLEHVSGALGPEFQRLSGESRAAAERLEAIASDMVDEKERAAADLTEIARALSAPREILYGDDGRPDGVRVDYEGGANGTAGEIVNMITKPKKLVRDADGKPKGVE